MIHEEWPTEVNKVEGGQTSMEVSLLQTDVREHFLSDKFLREPHALGSPLRLKREKRIANSAHT